MQRNITKNKVLIVGGENHHLRIPFAIKLAQQGFEISMAGVGSPEPFKNAGIEYYSYELYRFLDALSDVKTYKRLSNILDLSRPDIIQTFDTKPNILIPMLTRNNKNLLTVRTINGLGTFYSSTSFSSVCLQALHKFVHKYTDPWTDITVFQNSDDQKFFQNNNLIGRDKHALIRGSGVNIQEYSPEKLAGPNITKLRNDLGMENKEIVITVSRLAKNKGISTLLEAAGIVARSRPNVCFLLVGSGVSEEKQTVTSSEIGKHYPYVKSIGQRSDVPELLQVADVFAFPTEVREGIPRVLLEAASAELPIVSTNMIGCVDIVEDQKTGLLTTPKNPEKMAEKIIELLTEKEKAKRFAKNVRKLVEEKFSLDIIASQYSNLYLRNLEYL